MSATITAEPLTANDRCDRCGARAYLRALLPGGGELLFCAHHGRTHAFALAAADARVQDESVVLDSTSPTARDGEL